MKNKSVWIIVDGKGEVMLTPYNTTYVFFEKESVERYQKENLLQHFSVQEFTLNSIN